jgi:hypothetical protein
MAAMMVFWIALGALAGLAMIVLFADRRLSLTDAAAAGGLGAILTGSLFALIAGRGDWFDLLSTMVALAGTAAFVAGLRRIEGGGDRAARIGGDAGSPPRPAR